MHLQWSRRQDVFLLKSSLVLVTDDQMRGLVQLWLIHNSALLKTILDTFIQVCQLTCYQSQKCSAIQALLHWQHLISTDFLVDNLTQINQFLQKLDPLKYFSPHVFHSELKSSFLLMNFMIPKQFILIGLLDTQFVFKNKKTSLCKMCSSYTSDCWLYFLLECDAVGFCGYVPASLRNLLPWFATFKMEAAGSIKT